MSKTQHKADQNLDQGFDSSLATMQEIHIHRVVQIHLRSFPGFFLTFLGPRFLQVLYQEIIGRSDHIAYIAQQEDGIPIGFVAGVENLSQFYLHLARRRWLSLGVASLGALIRQPRILSRLFRALWMSGQSGDQKRQAVLMSVAVEPEMSSHGIGKKLVSRFIIEAKNRRLDSVSLVTDRDSNARVNRFYSQMGFDIARSYPTAEGRWMNEYTFELKHRELDL